MQEALYQLFLNTNPLIRPAAELSRNYESPAMASFTCSTSLLGHVLMEISLL